MYKSLSSLKLGEFWLVNVFIVHQLEKKMCSVRDSNIIDPLCRYRFIIVWWGI